MHVVIVRITRANTQYMYTYVYPYIEYSQMPKDVLRTVHSYTVLVHGGEHVLNIVSRYELSS